MPGAPAPPPGYAAPPGAAPATYPVQGQGQPGIAIAALVLGIVSILGGLLCWFLGIPVGIAGIVCGFIGRNQAQERGLPTSMATAGLICSVIGTLLGILFAVLVGAVLISTGS